MQKATLLTIQKNIAMSLIYKWKNKHPLVPYICIFGTSMSNFNFVTQFLRGDMCRVHFSATPTGVCYSTSLTKFQLSYSFSVVKKTTHPPFCPFYCLLRFLSNEVMKMGQYKNAKKNRTALNTLITCFRPYIFNLKFVQCLCISDFLITQELKIV